MKAIDYFSEYGEAVFKESFDENKHDELSKLYLAFVREMKQIIDTRSVKTNKAVIAVMKEMNQKWNALYALYEKKYGEGMSPIRRDGFWNSMRHEIPEVDKYEKPKEG